MTGDVGFHEFAPAAKANVWLNKAVRVFNLVLFEDFLEVERFKISGGMDDGAAFDM